MGGWLRAMHPAEQAKVSVFTTTTRQPMFRGEVGVFWPRDQGVPEASRLVRGVATSSRPCSLRCNAPLSCRRIHQAATRQVFRLRTRALGALLTPTHMSHLRGKAITVANASGSAASSWVRICILVCAWTRESFSANFYSVIS